jgi:cytochrome c
MTRQISKVLSSLIGVGALALCGIGVAHAGGGKPVDQVSQGAKLFAKNCAKCHGDHGEGGKNAPPVVGKAALPLDPPAGAKARTTQFHTAQDVAEFVVKNMPPKKPGSLKPEEYYAILAFDLKANGVDVTGKTIDAKTAAEIKLH